MADYTDAEFSGLLDQLARLPVEDRASDLLKLLKTLLTKNVTVQDWNTLIRDIAPLYATMLGLNDCMVNLINKVQRELGIVTESSDSALSRIIALEDGTLSLANDKFDKTGGTITGPTTITDKLDVKSLTVHGTTTTADATHLSVKDAIIETNVGAETAESIPLLSGYVIHIGNGNAYGIVYDKVAQSVKLGLVEKTAEGTYRFQNGEGQAVALRADTNDLITGRLVVWNGNKNRFETKFQVAQGATRMTIVQRNDNGEVITAENPKSDGAAVPKSMLNTKMDELSERVVHKGATLKAVYAHDENGNESMVSYTENATSWTIVQRATGGVVKVGTPVSGRDATTKEYVDNGFVAKVTTTSGANLAYVARNDGRQGMFAITTAPSGGTIAQRKQNGGALEVGTAVVDSDAMPKKQVEDGFVPIAQGRLQLYGTDPTVAGKVHMYQITPTPTASGMPQYGTNGVLKVGTPVGVHDATTKAYVDNGFVKSYVGNPPTNMVYVRTDTGVDSTTPVNISPDDYSIAQRGAGGALKVGTPADPKDAVNLEYLAAQLGAVPVTAPYFTHNVCITRTVDNTVDTIRISLVCTQVTKITSVAALHALIVQLSNNAAVGERSMPTWHGVCKMLPLTMAEGIPSTLTVYSGEVVAGEGTHILVLGDSSYPNAGYRIEPNDTDWTVSDSVLNAVVGGTTA